MAYKGYLIKIGNYIFPLSMIKAESYKATNYGQDLDSTRDVNGILHRTALENTAPKVEFETRNMLDNTQVSSIFANIQANYTNAVEKKASVEVYVPELNKYVTSDKYRLDFISFNSTIQIEYRQFKARCITTAKFKLFFFTN
jgi:hypothetical protein